MDLVYGSALWFAPVRVNCHHLTTRLAARRPTLFVESVGARAPRAHDWRRVASRLLRSARPLRRVEPNLWIYSPLPLPLWRQGGAAVNSRWVGWQVRVLLALRRWAVDVCWVFHPMGLGTAEQVPARGEIYYCVDDYAANPGVDAETVRAMEAALTTRATLTVTTGEPLAQRLRPGARRLEVLPNVADTELFGRDLSDVRHPVLDALDALPRPRLGYLGNLATYKIDLDLVGEIAHLRPDWTIALVGPLNLGDVRAGAGALAMPPNVHFVGAVPHDVAPAAIDRFDVGLLPSARHEVMKASFPLKFFEYLLRGRPVVARSLPMLEPFQAWYDAADTAVEFVVAASRHLELNDTAAEQARRRFAGGFGWPERMERLEQLRCEVLEG
jgi:glycosyltransferase involved in cell wall biosynthesis